MARIEFELKHGLKVGDDVLRHVVLGELTAGDIIEAGEASERVMMSPTGPVAVSSPTLMGALTMCRHIQQLGEGPQKINGPIELGMLKKFHAEDFELLETKLAELAVASAQAAEGMQQRGRTGGDGA